VQGFSSGPATDLPHAVPVVFGACSLKSLESYSRSQCKLCSCAPLSAADLQALPCRIRRGAVLRRNRKAAIFRDRKYLLHLHWHERLHRPQASFSVIRSDQLILSCKPDDLTNLDLMRGRRCTQLQADTLVATCGLHSKAFVRHTLDGPEARA
jgi:hypothetical protein